MADEYDLTSPIGQVRLLLNDVDPQDFVFADVEIASFLALEGQSVKRAAAQAIDTNATNEALASKVLKTPNVTTDGAKVADAMRKHADRLREQADKADDDADEGFFEVIPLNGQYSGPELTSWF